MPDNLPFEVEIEVRRLQRPPFHTWDVSLTVRIPCPRGTAKIPPSLSGRRGPWLDPFGPRYFVLDEALDNGIWGWATGRDREKTKWLDTEDMLAGDASDKVFTAVQSTVSALFGAYSHNAREDEGPMTVKVVYHAI